ncbi:MAG TPA: O-antigen ligase family protein [archaeon]|nr:O-antigen ligase family protein [archaeon]
MSAKIKLTWSVYLVLLPLNITYFLGVPHVMPADFLVPVLIVLAALSVGKRLAGVVVEDFPVLACLLIFLLVTALAAVRFGLEKNLALAALAQIELVVTYFLFRVTVGEARLYIRLVLTWVIVSTIVSAVGIIAVGAAYAGWKTPLALWYPSLGPGAWRLIGVTGHSPNFFCSYLNAGFFLSLGLLLSKKAGHHLPGVDRKFSVNSMWTAVAVHALALALTYSRGLLGLILGLIIIVQVLSVKSLQRAKFYKTALWTAFAVLFLYGSVFYTYTTDALFTPSQEAADSLRLDAAAPHHSLYSYKNVPHLENGAAYRRLPGGFTYLPSMHLYLLRSSWNLFARNPFFGIGPGRYINELKALREENGGLIPQSFPDLKPHSTLMGALAEGGIVGFAGLAILWLFFLGKPLWRKLKDDPLGLAIYAAMAGYLLVGLNMDIMNFRWLWLIFALAAARASLLNNRLPE